MAQQTSLKKKALLNRDMAEARIMQRKMLQILVFLPQLTLHESKKLLLSF